ncbi:MAG: DUF805 domain-containing protein [Deltaproteobacteria bacterium]|jgi:uncharacterized membrane protein YhaH (DUF805 family)|nr:DUF805 domain-containing protein [Deltaproteobacteria bacterium]
MFGYLSNSFNNFFSFQGRASRTEYWLFMISLSLLAMVGIFLFVLAGAFLLPKDNPNAKNIVVLGSVICYLAIFVGQVSILARRVHDIGSSAWLVLVAYIVPFVALVMAFMPGDKGPNKYGSGPFRPNALV